jgi:uncharacterized protein
MLKRSILLFTFLFCAVMAFAQEFPEKSTTLVTDYTNSLSAEDKQRLENKLVAFNDSSSTQIAIVLIKSVGEYDIAEYGAALGRKWGIGQKGKNNGLLILAAIGDRKITIQTGYGAEGAVPDIITHQIIDNDIKPHFRQNDYYGGLDAATDNLIKYTKGEYKADANTKKAQHKNGGGGGSAGFIIIIVIVILVLVFRNRGGGGGGRQVIGSRGGASPFWWFLAGSMLGGSGRSSGGGGWGGFSGGGGGDSGGGGFGGFGGGDFGGGGSSGSW